MSDEIISLPHLIAREFNVSTSEARRLLALGGVRIDGEVCESLGAPMASVAGKELQVGKSRRKTIHLETGR